MNTTAAPLAVTRLEDRTTPTSTLPTTSDNLIVSGAGAGSRPLVQLYRADGSVRAEFFAFDPAFSGGVNVAYADVNGDGVKDVIAAAGPGAGPHVKVFDGKSVLQLPDPSQPHTMEVRTVTELYSFYAFDPAFRGGVSVAAGDVNADGQADVVAGAGAGGGPHVRAFSGKTGGELRSFYAFDPKFTGGVNVAVGSLTYERFGAPSIPQRADILVGSGAGMKATVTGFDGRSGEQFFTINPYGDFTGGVYVAAGDTDKDGYDDVITGAGAGGGPHVTAYSGFVLGNLPTILLAEGGLKPFASFYAYDAGFRGGARVAASDLTGDGKADILTGSGPGAAPLLRVFNETGIAPLREFTKFGFQEGMPEYTSGVTVGG